MVEYFKTYATRYDFDYLMIAAQAYQEFGLDQSKKSAAGAVGVMQVLPSTAADPNVGIRDIEKLEKNIHAGTKYLQFTIRAEMAGIVQRLFDICSLVPQLQL